MQNFNLRTPMRIRNNQVNPISAVYHSAGNKLESKKKVNTLETRDPVDTCISGVHDFSVHELDYPISQPASPARLRHSGY